MLMTLGLFVFELPTVLFSELQHRMGWRHPSADRTGAGPASQFTGPGEDKITLSGACVPEAGNSASALLTLRDMGDTGEAFPLIDGTGFVYGNYKIENLDLRKKAFIDNGLPRMTDFAIDLVRDFG